MKMIILIYIQVLFPLAHQIQNMNPQVQKKKIIIIKI